MTSLGVLIIGVVAVLVGSVLSDQEKAIKKLDDRTAVLERHERNLRRDS